MDALNHKTLEVIGTFFGSIGVEIFAIAVADGIESRFEKYCKPAIRAVRRFMRKVRKHVS